MNLACIKNCLYYCPVNFIKFKNLQTFCKILMNQLLDYQKLIKIFCTDHSYSNSKYSYILTVMVKDQNYEVSKTKGDFENFHKQMRQIVFELEEPFAKKIIGKQAAEQVKDQINIYINHLLNRLDSMTNQLFVNFFLLNQSKRLSQSMKALVQKKWIHPITEFDINKHNQGVVSFEWDQKDQIIFVITESKSQSIPSKLTKFLKDIMSKPTNYGRLQIFKYSQKFQKWNSTYDQPIQAQPTHLVWSSKTSTLVVATTIGIYLYSVSQSQQSKGQYAKVQLIDFVQIPGINSFQYQPRTAQIYILSDGINHKDKGKLSVYSMKKQTMIDEQFKLISPQALLYQRQQKRLFISDEKGIHILHVPQVRNLAQFQYKHLIQCKSLYQQLRFNSKSSNSQKPQYMFGLSKKGFITVFQLKPAQKQNLIVPLTNIQCSSDWTSVQIIWSKKLFASSFNQNIVFIDMQNRPIWVWNCLPNKKSKIKKIMFDEENQRILVCNNQQMIICKMQF